MRRLWAIANIIFAVYIAICCSSGTGSPINSKDAGNSPQDAGNSDSDADADYEIDYTCGDDCPPDMVDVPGMCACIDAYEYTIENFAAFLNDRGHNECDGFYCRMMGFEVTYITNMYESINNGDTPEYIVAEAIKDIDGGLFQVTDGLEDFPVGLVTWYGANRACRWEGKRLCPRDVWYAACSHGGKYHYPYGGTTGGVDSEGGFYKDYVPDNCNTGGYGYTSQVGTFPDCEGGYDGIFDLAGNVEEWINLTADGKYILVGGSHNTNTAEDGEPENGAGCIFNGLNIIAEDGDVPGNSIDYDSGFRCCVMGNT